VASREGFIFQSQDEWCGLAAVRASYVKLLPLAGSRGDLNYLIGEMLGELCNSHTYVGGGDEMPEERRAPTAFWVRTLRLTRPPGVIDSQRFIPVTTRATPIVRL